MSLVADAPPGVRLKTVQELVPSNFAISACLTLELLYCPPPNQMLLAALALTSLKKLGPPGGGVPTWRHPVPFHWNAVGKKLCAELNPTPDAKARVGLTTVTSLRSLPAGPASERFHGVHEAPSQCSA